MWPWNRPSVSERLDRIERVLGAILTLTKGISMTQAELAVQLGQVKELQTKTVAEIADLQTKQTAALAKIDELNALIAAGGPITPELEALAKEVKVLATAADEAIPDLVPPTP